MLRNAVGLITLAVLGAVLWRLVGPRRADVPTQPAAWALSQPPVAPLRVFFVGNSHTFYHEMPEMLVGLARASGESGGVARAIEFQMDAAGGATLEDHARAARLPRALAVGRWDYVVLQEQQQRPAFRFNMEQVEREFFGAARALDQTIKAAGAKTLLYMTAARRDGDPQNLPGDSFTAMQERVRASYEELGSQLHAQVVPAGLAFRWVHQRRPDIPLWIADGMHPSRQGAYLIACSFYAALYQVSPEGNPYVAELPREQASFLQSAAAAVRTLP